MSIKTALDGIKPDEKLLCDTERMLREKLSTGKSRRPFFANRIAFVACFLAVISAFSVSAYAYYQTPVSYVSVDINPSVALGVNRFDRVVTVKSYGEETKDLLAGKKIVGSKPQEAVALLVKEAENGGFVKADGTTAVLIVTESKKKDKADSLLDECVKGVDSGRNTVAIYSDTAADGLKKEADSFSISAGKLKLIKMIQELDDTATVDDYRNDSVTSLLERITFLTSEQNTKASGKVKDSVRKNIEKAEAKQDQKKQKDQKPKNDRKKQTDNAASERNGKASGKNKSEDINGKN
jgi:hypothetical protein